MRTIFLNKIFKYCYMVLSFIVAILLCTHVISSFVEAWFTDSNLRHDIDRKVAQVEIVILQNNIDIGGEVVVTHNDPYKLEDDVYTFTPGTLPSYDTPAIGNSTAINLSVQNLGWAKGLVRIVGFEVFVVESTHRGDKNEVVVFTNQMDINYGTTDWVIQQVDDVFDDNDELKPYAYNLYLNRVIGGNTETDGSDRSNLVVSITNTNLNAEQFPKFYIRFLAEITVHESNAYDSNGGYPPFGPKDHLPTDWTAWQNANYDESFDPESGEVVVITPPRQNEPEPDPGE